MWTQIVRGFVSLTLLVSLNTGMAQAAELPRGELIRITQDFSGLEL